MRSLLIDTNVLVLLVVGTWDRSAIRAHRRTRQFAPADFDLLEFQMRRYARVLTTPGVLTEVSNLMGNDFHEEVAQTLVEKCLPLVEVIRPKEAVFSQDAFPRLGF